MTCDVEDYFQVSAFDGIVPQSRWAEVDCRIPTNVDRILQLFSDEGVKGTFFTLGWVAEHFPNVVRRIVGEGHELASHGMCHRRVWSQTPDEFRDDVTTSRQLLQDTGGTAVTGYRAASWSIDHRTPWAHGILAEAGYKYSSSVYPVSHDHYGMPDAPRHPYRIDGSQILEIPPSTARFIGRNIPVAGGGYFRLFPLALSKWFINSQQRKDAFPYVFYFHPWEMDPEQPRFRQAAFKARFRHYLNLEKFQARLSVLLKTFSWGRMDEIYLGGPDK
jgi:polysaccharide deacetylase family protein (PEP-CTERM system associated)